MPVVNICRKIENNERKNCLHNHHVFFEKATLPPEKNGRKKGHVFPFLLFCLVGHHLNLKQHEKHDINQRQRQHCVPGTRVLITTTGRDRCCCYSFRFSLLIFLGDFFICKSPIFLFANIVNICQKKKKNYHFTTNQPSSPTIWTWW